MLRFALFTLAGAALIAACDTPSSDADKSVEVVDAGSSLPPAPTAAPAPEGPRAPDIIVDRSSVAIGNEHLATGEPGLPDKIGDLLGGKPAIEGHTVDVVAMRNAKPSQVVAVVAALRGAKATGVNLKTAARDDTTQKIALSFASSLPDCAVVAWIAKDGVIDVWPAGGGSIKRIARGLAGPDMTLGTDAVRAQWAGCGSPSVAIGADDAMSWGLVFDLATNALFAPGSRANTVVLLPTAAPGKKLALPQ